MTKIDLDEIERKDRQTLSDPRRISQVAIDRADARIRLALIARIRDLETGVLQCGQAFAGVTKPPSPLALIELIERGAVLP